MSLMRKDANEDDINSQSRLSPVFNGTDSYSMNSSEDELETLSLSGEHDTEQHICQYCQEEFKRPRVLSCLHIFCEDCLRPLLIEDTICCPTCKTVTECENVAELPLDYVIANTLDLKAIQDKTVCCTSCKAKEKAVARCSDCANFLCPNCVTAHHFMRCFENHKVISFDDITQGDGIPLHRPITCSSHGSEEQLIKYFCNTCQMPICNECMLHDHKPPSHQFERISDIEKREFTLIMGLVKEAELKAGHFQNAATNLEQSLHELESQRDDARSLIRETFQSYKAILEKRQEALLNQLDQLHEQQELAVMDMSHSVEKTIESIEHACDFVKRVVSKSNSLELLSLKKTMSQRLMGLMSSVLSDKISMDIQFVTDNKKFESLVEENFGHFKLRDDSATKTLQHLQTLPARHVDRQISMATLSDPDLGYHTSSPPSLIGNTLTESLSPGLLLSSPESGLFADNHMRPILSHDYSSSFLASGMSLSSDIGMSRTGPVSLIGDGRSQSRQSQSPTVSDSGIGMDSTSPGLPPLSNLSNLAGLARLANLSLSSHGDILINNQAIPGLNINSIASMSHSKGMSSTSSPDHDLNSGLFSPPLGRAMMGSMDGLITPRNELTRSISSSRDFTSPTPSSQIGTPFAVRSKMSAMQIRAKFGQLGPGKGQFNSPHGFCMGIDEDIVVADTNNHRIQVFDKNGEFKSQFGIPGREEGQLWYPRKIAIMRNSGRYVICDRGNERSRMQIFTKSGHFVKKIAIRYIDIVAGLAITAQGNIVAVDSVSPTVFTISEGGDLIKWFDCSDYMREPSDIAVADKEYFVCDFKGHCVVVFNEDGQFQRRIGTDSITNFPNGIDISDAGDILVGDSHGNRFHVAVFQKDGSLIGEFECPYVKVSRCCGLKITAEGYVVTLAKNNHHVLVLNTLYIS